jgi:Mg-chelatase subunit ChlD
MDRENLGPAERILQTVLSYSDHLVHNRIGMITPDTSTVIGVRWEPISYKVKGAQTIVYRERKAGKRIILSKIGTLREDKKVVNDGGIVLGEFRDAGLFPEVAAWMYRQVSEVWKLDHEFAAKWASHAFAEDHRDLKVVLAAFMLVQSRKGDPIVDNGKVSFYDADYRDVGEAMMLIYSKNGKDMNPKLLLRMHDLLRLPEVAQINRELGFGRSDRKPFIGRWSKAVTKWLEYREENPKLLEGLVKAGLRSTVMSLAQRVGYKPASPKFFELLRWKQKQAKDGRRDMAIGVAVTQAESWDDLTEEQICERIQAERIGLKRVEGMLPKNIGLTRAIMASIIEANLMSDKDLIIRTPTLEELGLLNVVTIKARWERALKNSEDMRAANIARNVTSNEIKEKLQDGADNAIKKAAEEVINGIRIYFIVDISGSMNASLQMAKEYVAKFVQGIPLDHIHACVFNTQAREVPLRVASKAGIDNAFMGFRASGGTDYGCGVRHMAQFKPKEEEDSIIIFVGDEGQRTTFENDILNSGLRPMAFGLIKVPGERGSCVVDTAAKLNIPCFNIDNRTFEDVYAITRTLRNLIAATPVRQAPAATFSFVRETLVDKIIKVELLHKPAWAS